MPGKSVTVRVHPQVAAMMLKEEASTINYLEEEIDKQLTIVPMKDIHLEKYEIVWEAD